jgi:hypothetical protein
VAGGVPEHVGMEAADAGGLGTAPSVKCMAS